MDWKEIAYKLHVWENSPDSVRRCMVSSFLSVPPIPVCDYLFDRLELIQIYIEEKRWSDGSILPCILRAIYEAAKGAFLLIVNTPRQLLCDIGKGRVLQAGIEYYQNLKDTVRCVAIAGVLCLALLCWFMFPRYWSFFIPDVTDAQAKHAAHIQKVEEDINSWYLRMVSDASSYNESLLVTNRASI